MSPRVRRLRPARLGWHTSPECVFVMLCSFDLLSFEFRWFSMLSPACALMHVGILDLPLFPLSVPLDVRTRGSDPLEPFLGPFGTSPWPWPLFPCFCCLGAYRSRRPDQPCLGASLCRRPDTRRLPLQAPSLLFERRQGQAPLDWVPTPAGVLLSSFGRRLLQAPNV